MDDFFLLESAREYLLVMQQGNELEMKKMEYEFQRRERELEVQMKERESANKQ